MIIFYFNEKERLSMTDDKSYAESIKNWHRSSTKTIMVITPV
jgi:hypothetical protein